MTGCGGADKPIKKEQPEQPYKPMSPTELSMGAASANAISLIWADGQNSELLSAYELFRDGVLIKTLAVDEFAYTDTELQANTSYVYSLRAVGSDGEYSDKISASASTSTTPYQPLAPTELNIIATSANTISLRWSDVQNGELLSSYELFRGGQLIKSIAVDVFTYTDTQLEQNTAYVYSIRAVSKEGEYSQKASTSASTAEELPYEPMSPTELSMSAASTNTISLSWTDGQNNKYLSAYELFRDGGLIKTLAVDVLTYTDNNLKHNTSYVYSLRAVSSEGQYSPQISISASTVEGEPVVVGVMEKAIINAMVYTVKDPEQQDVLFTPTEALSFCEDLGLDLGLLPPYQSQAMMDLQAKYSVYADQVGRSFETREPVAVSVNTIDDADEIQFADAGRVIVCANTEDSYIIKASEVNVNYLDHGWSDGFDMDDISVSYKEGYLQVSNRSPRQIHSPLIKLDDNYFVIDHVLEPYSVLTFTSSEYSTLAFIDQAPFWKLNMTGFQTEVADGWVHPLTEDQAATFVDLIIRHKWIGNRFDTNLLFLDDYIFDAKYDNRQTYSDHEFAQHAFHNMLTHKSTSRYGMLDDAHSALGVATLGNGSLALSRSRIEEAKSTMGNTYSHERLHNHGFGHDTGMTYGWTDVLTAYGRNNGYYHYLAPELVQEKNALFAQAQWQISGTDSVSLHVNFASTVNRVELNQFIVSVKSHDINSIKIYDANEAIMQDVTLDRSIENKAWLFYEGAISLPARTIAETNQNLNHYQMVIDMPFPSAPMEVVINARGADDSQSLAAFFTYDIRFGIKEQEFTNAVIYMEKDTDGQDILYTPEEALSYCEDKGLDLGVLPAYKSRNMMDLQTKYAKYADQVGRSFETGEPVAVSVPTTYSSGKIHYTRAGRVIVCSN
ncbi:hypothetical protein EZV61_09575 [Corallincola luteus]|uniref:Fibronectin type-III domain-containing protein n=1 Tax=Corallincola luteus TaxID=1775177 RepID=A0ABY2ALH4_9GAMM|nr:hypothetical protein [Corallincola luteus]TCI03774.1 hypothetical protein EZV61_09575 [Corallincola luteus]